MKLLPGIIICALLGTIAWTLGLFLPLGAVTFSILLGMLLANTFKISSRATPGISFSEKKILPVAIALLGFSLNYNVLLSFGVLPLILIFLGIPFTILTALIWGKLFGIEKEQALLIGVGNGVCGSSAIVAVQGVVKTNEKNVGMSVAIINLLGTAGIFILPFLLSLTPLFSQQIKGMIIGNTLQAVGQVTAAGFSLGNDTGQVAVIVKMGRILLISPVVLIVQFIRNPKAASLEKKTRAKVPLYILVFILFSAINTAGFLPESMTEALQFSGEVLLITAMAGIGMKITFRGLAQQGKNSLMTGILTWAGQILFTFLIVFPYQILFL
ncbi:putative sulfate exporter family transporter [Oceanispirochaeta crateris]|uniref:Putative sulfate exporter family transporter n=1 Tax=Oceanispirochaeta crateris TaxID=2518645 RepID=A0A5C1QHH8_9SPIO|nr:putative sulfate exporter family transporter [Oceanispirochaeta crateris]QEN06559.1 putative sulfate exporter family transporter [Oceanispirochaeta crateris]